MTLAQPLMAWMRGASDPEVKLLEQAKSGSHPAFDTLRSRYAPALHGFIARRVGADAADDLSQEVWLACWTDLPQFAARSRFKAWLYGIAVHKCMDHLRERARHARREEAAKALETPENACAVLERRQDVLEALSLLPEAQRDVIELYYYAELTLAEIAQALGRNLNTVKYQFYRAHGQMEKQLRAEEKALR